MHLCTVLLLLLDLSGGMEIEDVAGHKFRKVKMDL